MAKIRWRDVCDELGRRGNFTTNLRIVLGRIGGGRSLHVSLVDGRHKMMDVESKHASEDKSTC